MAEGYSYISFYRSRFGFMLTFFGLIILAFIAYSLSQGLIQIALIFILLLILIGSFYYEFYLSDQPVIEVAKDSVSIKEIYHPIIKWRFFYKGHIFGFNQIAHIKINLTKAKQPKHITITYYEGTGAKDVHVNKRDVSQFESFVRLIIDRTPSVVKEYKS